MDTLEVIEKPFKNVSYLCARDPSIITWGGLRNDARQNLEAQFGQKTENHEDLPEYMEDDGLLQVYLRIKNAQNFESLYEIVDDKSLLCKIPSGAHCNRNVREGHTLTKLFTFSKIFSPNATQLELFNSVIKVKVLRFINGLNSSLLTYGASGSGKTFTIIGTPEQPGIVPQALEYMFRTLPSLPQQPRYKPTSGGGVKKLTDLDCKLARSACLNLINVLTPVSDRLQHSQTYRAMQARLSEEPVAVITQDISHVNLSVWVSFAEIYNEYVFDLLKGESGRGLHRQKLRVVYCNGSAYIKDLTCINVSSGLEAYQVLQFGLQNLNYAATALNDHSSRSHSIFSIKLAQTSDTKEGISVSCFNFCDLAGSERIKKTHHVGERLKESNNINTSLLVLGRCINLVRESQKRSENIPIPFRESKLTQLFQQALQGFESISMIVNINPVRDMFDESQHVLNFSAIAREVTVVKQIIHSIRTRPSDTICKTDNHNSMEKQKLIEQIELLYDEIEQLKLDHDEDRQNLINTYKQIVDNTTQHWEERCKQLYEMYANQVRKDDAEAIPNKKRKISIINLDSSDEDTALAKANQDQEIIDLKYQLEAKEKALTTYKERCEFLENQINQLHSENYKQKEQLTELNEYINAIQQPKSDLILEDKENSNPNSCKEYLLSSTAF